MHYALTVILLVLSLPLAAAARAHPHVWIDMRSSVNFNTDGAVDAIGVSWTFDEFYSQFATDGIDANKNGMFDPSELQSLANTYAKNLKDYRYFTFVQMDGKLAETGAPTNAKAVFTRGQLTFVFRLPLSKPVDPARVNLSYSVFDPTYYIDIAPAEANGVTLVGSARKGCTFALRKVDTTRPGALNLSQSIKMTQPVNDVLNATNAAIVDIKCPSSKPQ